MSNGSKKPSKPDQVRASKKIQVSLCDRKVFLSGGLSPPKTNLEAENDGF